jgi:hypothetical protein
MAKKGEAKANLARQAARRAGKVGRSANVPLRKKIGAARAKPANMGPPKPAVAGSRLAESIPDEAAIQKLLVTLAPEERSAVNCILQGLEERLGSSEAARIWLVIKSPEFGTTPLEAIRNGKGKVVQAVLEARWGPNPTYA